MCSVRGPGRYLIALAQEHLEFRIPELESITSIFGKKLSDIWEKSSILGSKEDCKTSNFFEEINTPYIVLDDVHEQDVLDIISRSIFAKYAYEIWGHGSSYQDLKKSILSYKYVLKEKYFAADASFCIRVKANGRKISLSEQIGKIESLEDTLPFQGQVSLNSPDNEFHIVEDYGSHKGKKLSGEPHYVYFGRMIGEGQRCLMQSYSVKKRKFIGNTSMEAGLSFLMSNLAKVESGNYVCDPFVGTGSLLIAAAHFGAYVTGGDINYNILHARGKSSRVGAGLRAGDETIKNSLGQYGLGKKYVDVLVHDLAKHPWKGPNSEGIFDAIITDPPYGIRESCRKVGTDKEVVADPIGFDVHHPEQTAYHLDHVFSDLLTFASCLLVPGGRLVYWIPIYRPEYCDDNIPKHPSFKILYNCEQLLKRETSRRLIVMEKIQNTDSQSHGNFLNNVYKGHNAFRNKYFKVGR